jgi:hypothetical protein
VALDVSGIEASHHLTSDARPDAWHRTSLQTVFQHHAESQLVIPCYT